MSLLNISPILSRLSKCAMVITRTITTDSPLQFGVTNVLLAEPLKKKKKMDPNIIRQREEKKRKKLEKSIRRLEKFTKRLKPISELTVPMYLKAEKERRTRKLPSLTEEEDDRRALLSKDWCRYKRNEFINDSEIIERFIASQIKALNELKKESEELYNEAIQIDCSLLPYETQGPCHTPPIENYDCPDGEYIDLTIKYPGET